VLAIKTFKTYKKHLKKDKTCWWQSTQC